MTTARAGTDYGMPTGGYIDAATVEDSNSEMAAAYGNRLIVDHAQMTATTTKWVVQFPSSTAAAAAIAAASVNIRSHFGSGTSSKPAAAKIATGTYTLTFASSYNDELTLPETITFFDAWGHVLSSSVVGHVQASISGTVITVLVSDMAGAASDLTNGTTISVHCLGA